MNRSEQDRIKELKLFFKERADQVRYAYLFGSTARGDQSIMSDIDIAVYFETGTKDVFEAKLSLHADLCRTLKRSDVDVIVLNAVSNLMLLDEVVRTGLVLYDADPESRSDFELRILHQALDFKHQRAVLMGV